MSVHASAGLVLLSANALGGAAVAVVGALGTARRLPRNRWAGVRLPVTMASDAAWEAAHRAAGPVLLAGGAAAMLASLSLLPFALSGRLGAEAAAAFGAALAAVIMLTAVAATVVAVRGAKRAVPPATANGDTR